MGTQSFNEEVDRLVAGFTGTSKDDGSINDLLMPRIPDLSSGELKSIIVSLKNELKKRKENEFAKVYSCNHGKLGIRSTPLGREVELTLTAHSTFEDLRDEINQRSQKKYGRDAIRRRQNTDSCFRSDSSADEERTFIFIPVIEGAVAESEMDIRILYDFLSANDMMNSVDEHLLLSACGMFRLGKGVPMDIKEIGTQKDKGDLLQGNVVVANIGLVRTYEAGAGYVH